MPTLVWNDIESYARGLCAIGLCLTRLGYQSRYPNAKGWRTAPPMPEDECVAWVMTGNNLAVKTGTHGVSSETRVIVLDLDVKHGEPAIETAKARGWLVTTWTLRTLSGGLHAYYLAPDPLNGTIHSSASKLAPGVDIKGHGSLAVAPGSRMSDEAERIYRWEHGLAPGQVALAPIPAALASALREAGSWSEANEDTPPPVIDIKKRVPLAMGEDPLIDEPGAPHGQRGSECARLCGVMIAEEIPEAIALPSLLAWAGRCVPPMPPEEATKTWESIKAGDQLRHPDRHTDRARVRLTDDLPGVLDQIEAELRQRCPPGHPSCIYRHGKELVYASRAGIEAITTAHLREAIATHVRMKIPGARGGGMLAPLSVVAALMERPLSKSQIPVIEGITRHPVLVPSGKGWRVSEPGYDAQSRLVGLFEPISDLGHAETAEDARACADAILAPFAEFPWWGPADRAAYLALLLSLVMRSAYQGPSPCFAIRASMPGSGKTLLARAVTSLLAGEEPAMLPPLPDGGELRKTLLGLARDGTRYIVIDNCGGSIGSAEMAQAITADVLQGRVLGTSVMVSVPWRAVMVVTGNNISFRADMARRVVPIDLKLTMARPESRRFRIKDLLTWVRQHREMLLAKLLGLALGFTRQQGSDELEPYGGFEGWSQGPRATALWALGIDPCGTRERLADDDDDLSSIREVLSNWVIRFGLGARLSSVEVQAKASQHLQNAIGAMTPSGRWDAQAIGMALRQIHGRVCGGLVMDRWENRGSGASWSVRRADQGEL